MSARRSWLAISLLAVGLAPQVASQAPGEYLLSVLGCNGTRTTCSNPKNHQIYLLYSDDGASWSVLPGVPSFTGSVPDVVRRDDTIYVYMPQVLLRYHISTGQWDPPVSVSLFEKRAPWGYVDPSVRIDDQGRICMIYLPGDVSGNLGLCPPGVSSCVKEFLSAVEVIGTDGAMFEGVPGVPVSVQLQQGQGAWDPDWFFDGQRYVCYISRGQSVQVYTSSSLHGTYSLHSALPNGMLVSGFGGVPSGRFDPVTQRYWTYVHTTRNGQTVVRRAVHASLDQPLRDEDFQTVLQPSALGISGTVGSPGIAPNYDHMGTAIAYGASCGGPKLSGNGFSPALGSVGFELKLSGAASSALMATMLGTSSTSISLTGFGWPGCALLASPDVVLAGTTSAAGDLTVALAIPVLPALLGGTLYAQAIVASLPGTASAGLAVSIGRT